MVFSSTDFSYHGHPQPLAAPADRARRSLALYYYTVGRPSEECLSGDCDQKKGTLFKEPRGCARRTAAARFRQLVPTASTGGDLDCDSDPPGYESEAWARHRLGCAVPTRAPRLRRIVADPVTVVMEEGPVVVVG